MRYPLDLDFKTFIELVNKALQEKQEDILIQRWIPYQSEISFTDFKNKLIKVKHTTRDTRTGKEILDQVENILKNLHGGDDL